MVGVVCAGGLGTRLYPLTRATNKHLLPVWNKPMVYYPIRTLVTAGIKDVVVVVGGPHAGHFLPVLSDGHDLGLNHIYYSYQQKEGGIADAIACAKDYAEGNSIAVILGDNCTDADISKEVETFDSGAKIFLKEVSDPQRFGVPAFDGNKITNIYEKPVSPPSNYAVVGLYLYDETVFDRISQLKPSSRGELEVTDLNNSYLAEGCLGWSLLDGYWKDAGEFESLHEVGSYWRNKERG